MDLSVRERSKVQNQIRAGTAGIRRRRVIYIGGYEPRSAEGHYKLFKRECDRFQSVWPVTSVTVKPRDFDSEDFACWLAHVRAPNWQVSTAYDVLRIEKFIQSDLAEPVVRHMLRALGWIIGDIVSGTQWRIFFASWRFGQHLLFVQLVLLAWLALSSAIGGTVGYLVADRLDSMPAGVAAALLAALASFRALQPLATWWGAIQIPSCWVLLRKFARGRDTWLDQAVDAGARRLVAAAEANDADELVVVGHSAGCVIASAVIARALELDPDIGRRGRRLVLLTLGSVVPAAALHPAAQRMREIVRRLAVEPTLSWIDCRFRRDIMTFMKFDPVDGVGVHVGRLRCNPLIWCIPFKDMLSPDDYRRLRWKFFRVHFQYLMASHRPCPYDYILLVGGPAAIAEWAEKHDKLTLSFITDGIRDDRDRRDLKVGAAR
jgi:hypothetical protein